MVSSCVNENWGDHNTAPKTRDGYLWIWDEEVNQKVILNDQEKQDINREL